MRPIVKILTIITCSLLSIQFGYAQDLENIGGEKPLKISGGTSLNQVFYNSSAEGRGRDPYTFVFTGNLNFDLYGWSVPLSFTYSNQNTAFQQPFNQYGLRPKYKWVTAHLGYSSMSFSPYTLNGHIFNGVGVELAPEGRFKFSSMYGRLLKAVEPDSLSENTQTPAYTRMAYAFKLTYDYEGDVVDVILFRSGDEVSSISYIPEDEGILPEENLVLSVRGEKTLLQNIKISAEYANSALSRDTRAGRVERSPHNIYAYAGGLYRQRLSSSYYGAFKSSLRYVIEAFTVGLNYERIDPGYETHGAYYFNNDLENLTASFSTRFWNKKGNLAANAGVQRNNLDDEKLSEMKRLVGSLNLGVVPTERLNMNLSYSNFQSYTNIRSQFDYINQLTPYDNYDTLNYRQINHTVNFNTSYYLSPASAENKKMITSNLSYNRSNDEQGDTDNISSFYNANIALSSNYRNSGLGLTLSMNVTRSELANNDNLTLGPTLAISKAFLENKIRSSISAAYNTSYVNGDQSGEIMNFRLNGGYKIGKKHNLNASLFLMLNNTQTEVSDGYEEFTGTLGYAFRF